MSPSPVAIGIDEALEKACENVTIDCKVKEIVRFQMRALVSSVITNCDIGRQADTQAQIKHQIVPGLFQGADF